MLDKKLSGGLLAFALISSLALGSAQDGGISDPVARRTAQTLRTIFKDKLPSNGVPKGIKTQDDGGDGGTTPGDGGGDGGTTPGDGGTTPGDGGTTPGDGGTTPGDGGTTPGDGGDPTVPTDPLPPPGDSGDTDPTDPTYPEPEDPGPVDIGIYYDPDLPDPDSSSGPHCKYLGSKNGAYGGQVAALSVDPQISFEDGQQAACTFLGKVEANDIVTFRDACLRNGFNSSVCETRAGALADIYTQLLEDSGCPGYAGPIPNATNTCSLTPESFTCTGIEVPTLPDGCLPDDTDCSDCVTVGRGDTYGLAFTSKFGQAYTSQACQMKNVKFNAGLQNVTSGLDPADTCTLKAALQGACSLAKISADKCPLTLPSLGTAVARTGGSIPPGSCIAGTVKCPVKPTHTSDASSITMSPVAAAIALFVSIVAAYGQQ